jgi:16S rRNA (cytidine1402-2'-O)-methyltransferase
MEDGKLYIIPTPIGNLADITFRAIEYLKEAEIVLVEDTRVSAKLFKHYDINPPRKIQFHKFNEHKQVGKIIELLKDNFKVALISDAGTPGISDPAYLLVKSCINEGIDVETLPGATAFVPALVNSGLPSHNFVFEGFLPVKKGRTKKLETLKTEERTMIFYESPHKLLKTLADFINYFGAERQISVSKELTKIHEETIRGTLQEVKNHFESLASIKGEYVLVVEGYHKD